MASTSSSSSPSSISSGNPCQANKVWIGNLDPKVTEYQLLKLAEPFGKISKFDFVYTVGPQGQRVPRGYAFVTFESSNSAHKAIRNLDGVKLLNRPMKVKTATTSVSSNVTSTTSRKRTLEECRKDMQKSSRSSQDKIRAMEAKLAAMQAQEDSFKLAIVPSKKAKS